MDLQVKKIRPEVAEALHKLRFRRFLNSSMLPKRLPGFCKWCGEKSKWTWCSDRCRKEAYIRIGMIENQVFNRDKGLCADCGIDTDYLQRQIREIKRVWSRYRYVRWSEHRAAFGPWWTVNYRYWEADHIIPVIEGGGCCGLDNYQTLCLLCHKTETAMLAKKRAAQRKDQLGLFAEQASAASERERRVM